MKKILYSFITIMMVTVIIACEKEDLTPFDLNNIPKNTNARVPAEWETREATWMQWPNEYDAGMRPAFAEIIKIIRQYEPVHLIANTEAEKAEAIQFLTKNNVPEENIIWHIYSIDNCWLRDNGPVYVTDGSNTWIQNWKFDGWGSSFGGDIPYANDNKIPSKIADYLNLEVQDIQSYILEKGNIEVNGAGTLLINWSCQKHRNPHISQENQETILKNALGVTKIIWAYGYWNDDGTVGHIDGTARFVNENTVFIADYDSDLENNLARVCRDEGLEVIMYPGDPNWLVGNGFVVAMGDEENNETLKTLLETYFPDRDIYMVDGSEIAKNGGGIHCVTNDQPVIL